MKCFLLGHLWKEMFINIYKDSRDGGGYFRSIKQCARCGQVTGKPKFDIKH